MVNKYLWLFFLYLIGLVELSSYLMYSTNFPNDYNSITEWTEGKIDPGSLELFSCYTYSLIFRFMSFELKSLELAYFQC